MIVVKSDFDRFSEWQREFNHHGIDSLPWSERHHHLDAVRYALVWQPEQGSLAALPALQVVFSVGAGVDHLTGDNIVPEGIPVVRMVEDTLTAGIVEYVVCHALGFHRELPAYAADKAQRRWRPRPQIPAGQRRIGILGLGVLGSATASALRDLGFIVAGWSRHEKFVDGVRSYYGDDQLEEFLGVSDILACLLPDTPDTKGIINRHTLELLPQDACFINAGRGAAVVDTDLIDALQKGRLGGAALDVFNQEPLPPSSPYWQLDNVFITPHVASMTQPVPSARYVAENIRRHQQGLPLTNLADLTRGY